MSPKIEMVSSRKVDPKKSEDFVFAKALGRVAQSPLRDILPQVARPGVISLALGMPAPELFPRKKFTDASIEALRREESTQYGEPHTPLKKHIVDLMAQRGVTCREEQIFLTAGAQQGLSLLTQLLLDPGAAVITEDTIYDGLQMVLRSLQAKTLTVPTCLNHGMDLDAVEALLGQGKNPAFIYAITDGHNPLGVSMSDESRHRLVDLARTWRVPILEDDAYGFLNYNGALPKPLRSLDDQWVFYLGSFSKILAPSLRTGWVVVPPALISNLEDLTSKLSILKQAADFDTGTLMQRTIAAYLDTGDFPTHLETTRQEYTRRRDTMLEALDTHFPREIKWNTPSSGLFVWIELPPGTLNAYQLLTTAIATEKVAFLPGQAFDMDSKRRWNRHCLRLCFSNSSQRVIEEGVERLGRVIKSALTKLRTTDPDDVGDHLGYGSKMVE